MASPSDYLCLSILVTADIERGLAKESRDMQVALRISLRMREDGKV